MECVKCGAVNETDVGSCLSCGASLRSDEPVSRPAGPASAARAAGPQKQCPKCGSANVATFKFCSKCGTPLLPPGATARPPVPASAGAAAAAAPRPAASRPPP